MGRHVEGERPGAIFWGTTPKATLWSPTSTSYLCVKAPVVRTGVYAQGWFRDVNVPKGTSLSDGITFTVCP